MSGTIEPLSLVRRRCIEGKGVSLHPATVRSSVSPTQHYPAQRARPFADYKSRQGNITSASLLWWLVSYENPDADHSDFHFLGVSKMALVRRMTSPRESLFEFNPIIPLYRYRHETERGSSWDLFGGLVGMDTAKEQTRTKLFWLSL